MKVKNFIVADINQALLQIKQELGADAIILSQEKIAAGVQVTAAVDEKQDFNFDDAEQVHQVDTGQFFDENKLRKALEYHNVTEDVQYQILSACRDVVRRNPQLSDIDVLTQALPKVFCFSPLLESRQKLQMFMGTPGAGKSTAIAKAATQAKLQQGQTPAIVSTDNIRAGANLQLKAFAEILEADFYFFKTPQDLFKFLQNEALKYPRVFIDTPGLTLLWRQRLIRLPLWQILLRATKF